MKQYCETLTRDFGHLDLYKQAIIARLLIPHVSGAVCDMGSSYTGLYRSLATIHKVDSLTFFDIDQKLLDTAEDILQSCTQEYFDSSFDETLVWLQKNYHINADYKTILELRNELINPSVQYSFLDSAPIQYQGVFDTIVCLESLECCDSEENLSRAILHCVEMLRTGGKLIISVLRYRDSESFIVKHLRDRGHEGGLNPDIQTLKKICADAGLELAYHDCMNTSAVYGQYGYEEAIFIVASKK